MRPQARSRIPLIFEDGIPHVRWVDSPAITGIHTKKRRCGIDTLYLVPSRRRDGGARQWSLWVLSLRIRLLRVLTVRKGEDGHDQVVQADVQLEIPSV